jgi:hypothetical protein
MTEDAGLDVFVAEMRETVHEALALAAEYFSC